MGLEREGRRWLLGSRLKESELQRRDVGRVFVCGGVEIGDVERSWFYWRGFQRCDIGRSGEEIEEFVATVCGIRGGVRER